MVYCAVVGCSSTNIKKSKHFSDCRFFRFPKNKQICDQWIVKCNQKRNFNLNTARVCSNHFSESDYSWKEKWLKLPEKKWRLKTGAIPSLRLMQPTTAQTAVQKRTMRVQKNLNRKLVSKNGFQEPNVETQSQHEAEEILQDKIKTVSTQTNETDPMKQIEILQAKNLHLEELLLQEREERRKIEQHITKRQLCKLLITKQNDY